METRTSAFVPVRPGGRTHPSRVAVVAWALACVPPVPAEAYSAPPAARFSPVSPAPCLHTVAANGRRSASRSRESLLHPIRADLRPIPPAQRDSAEVLKRMREAQDRFERTRRHNLPWTWRSWGSHCDERVGRMCMRYDEGDWQPTPEPPEIRSARDALLAGLEAAAAVLPGHPWIVGQRIRYLAEAGRWAEAERVSRSCRLAEPGRCDALAGFVLHGRGRYPEAEAAFERALAAMDPAEATRWRDPSMLMEDLGDVIRSDPERRDELTARSWLLSDPLFLEDGNDRLTEHYARYVAAWSREDARTAYGMSWGPDLEELLVRYGWEVGWERTRPGPGESRRSGVVGHHHPDALTYVPPAAFVATPADPDPEHWELDRARPRSSYAPAYAPEMSRADVQVARFWRGDSVRVVAAYRMVPPHRDRHDSPRAGAWTAALPEDLPVEAGVFLVPDRGGAVHGRIITASPAGALTLSVPSGSYLISIEAWSRERAVASRSRFGIAADPVPPGVPALSDALVVDPEGGLPTTLGEAVGSAWPGSSVPPGRRLGLAWELWGVGPQAEAVDYRITLEAEDRGFVDRATSLFGLLGDGRELTLAWSESTAGTGKRQFRATHLDLPRLSAGRYRLTLEATLPGRSTMVTSRVIRIRDER